MSATNSEARWTYLSAAAACFSASKEPYCSTRALHSAEGSPRSRGGDAASHCMLTSGDSSANSRHRDTTFARTAESSISPRIVGLVLRNSMVAT